MRPCTRWQVCKVARHVTRAHQLHHDCTPIRNWTARGSMHLVVAEPAQALDLGSNLVTHREPVVRSRDAAPDVTGF